jgi:hypothetical protein
VVTKGFAVEEAAKLVGRDAEDDDDEIGRELVVGRTGSVAAISVKGRLDVSSGVVNRLPPLSNT